MNNFLDKVGNKISSTSKEVTQKAKDFAETTKLNSAINTEQNRIDRLFTDLGKKYYEVNGENPETDYEFFIENINKGKQNISDLLVQINNIKNADKTVNADTCSECGAELNKDALFCTRCGAKVIPKETVEVVELSTVSASSASKICPTCNKALPEDAVFCTECGTKI